MKSLYANYNPKDNTMSLVVQIENKIIELEPVKQTEEFQNKMIKNESENH